MAADLWVGVGQPYASIQDAIDAASYGDRVRVTDGVYVEQLYLGGYQSLTVESVNGPSTVTVMAAPGLGALDTVWFNGSDAVFRGITVNGNFLRRSVLVNTFSSVTLDNVVLLNGIASDLYGGGNVDVYGSSSATISNSQILDGVANVPGATEPWGGNVRVELGCDLTLTDVDVSGGVATRGGGVHVEGGAILVWAGGSATNNRAVGPFNNDGGGLYSGITSAISVEEVVFSFNEAGTDVQSEGAGAFVTTDADFVSCTFENNLYTHRGGGLAAFGGSVTVSNSVFTNNSAQYGGGFSCVGNTVCKIDDNWFENNTAQTGGAGYANATQGAIKRNSFCQNTSTGSVGPAGDGGALYLSGSGAGNLLSVVLYNNLFFENSSEDVGGAIRVEDIRVTSFNNNYIGNSSYNFGGAVAADNGIGFATGFNSTNDFVAYNISASAGGFGFGFAIAPETAYNFYWNNVPDAGPVSMLDTTSQIDTSDPMINGYVPGDCDPFLQRPRLGSPLLGAGSPFISNPAPDNRRSHIGAFGGPFADNTLFVDGDNDGVIGLYDCIDSDGAYGAPGVFFLDNDLDGVGSSELIYACERPDGTALSGGDCDDWDAAVGLPPVWYLDDDFDNYGVPEFPVQSCGQPFGYADNPDDCDDSNPNIHPGVPWYRDGDEDSYGDPATPPTLACFQPAGWVSNDEDCDDSSAAINPTNPWYLDADLDGLGTGSIVLNACNPGPGFSVNTEDCDDTSAAIGGPTAWFGDSDGDGYGSDASESLLACELQPGLADNSLDCDDRDDTIWPGAPEYCDGIDHSCDGLPFVPEPVDIGSYYQDADGDGAGDPATIVKSCEPRDDLVEDGKDCDDNNPDAYPGAEELWYNGVDNDCLGGSDFDQDGDGFDALGLSAEGTDCDDLNKNVNPDAVDRLDDGLDANCDGIDARSWMVGGGGCGACSQSGAPAGGWLAMVVGLLAIRRRKRTPIH